VRPYTRSRAACHYFRKERVVACGSCGETDAAHEEDIMRFIVRGVPQEVADEVRRTRRSPGYGHPAHLEVATGTGPCRCCLRTFVPGEDRRLLFTYRPPGRGSVTAPGPVFIHAGHCQAFAGEGFPEGLRMLPLAIEARTADSRVTAFCAARSAPETRIQRLFTAPDAQWLQLRHAEAGCFIAMVDPVAGGRAD
jgi:hypothetical protein